MANAPLDIAWYDGRLQPIADIHISPLDRGFLFGDGVYEVIPFYGERAVGHLEHLDRLEKSLRSIALPMPMRRAELEQVLLQVINANDCNTQALYLQISRSGDVGRDHQFPKEQQANLFVMSSRMTAPSEASYASGLKAILRPDERWSRCDIKSTSLLANVMAKQDAGTADAADAVLYRDDQITEGAASAFACVVNNTLVAPPLTKALLPSVTREITWRLAGEIGLATAERDLSVPEFLAADEVILMSSTKEIAPIVKVDDHAIGDGTPGPVWRQLFQRYQDEKQTG
ncbi:MAG: aminotransferase class IV [Woeseiaceae bacterium]